MSASTELDRRAATAGFTLIEVLVALVVVAVSLTAIGALMAVNARTTRALDDRLQLVTVTRTLLDGLPERDRLASGRFTGELSAHGWRMDVRPFQADFVDPSLNATWVPQEVTLSVASPGGETLRVETIRLRRRSAGGR